MEFTRKNKNDNTTNKNDNSKYKTKRYDCGIE